MKVSKDTLDVLKNFSGIQCNLLIEPGSTIKTISEQKNVLAECKVADTFDTEIAIYDLNKFIGVISLFKDPDFQFNQKSVCIKEADPKAATFVEYRYAEKRTLKYPDRDLNMPDVAIEFTLKKDDLEALLKASAVMGVGNFILKGDGETAELLVCDLKNVTSNTYSVGVKVVNHSAVGEYIICLNADTLKFIPDDYNVQVTKQVCRFESVGRAKNGLDLVYHVATESTSSKLNVGEAVTEGA